MDNIAPEERQKLWDSLLEDPTKPSFWIEGYQDSELRSRVVNRDLDFREFDGHRLDQIFGKFNIAARDDCDELILFLQIVRYCFKVPKSYIKNDKHEYET